MGEDKFKSGEWVTGGVGEFMAVCLGEAKFGDDGVDKIKSGGGEWDFPDCVGDVKMFEAPCEIGALLESPEEFDELDA